MISKDILWKGIIEDLFDDFLPYFFPDLSQEIDFQAGFEFLDKELDTLLPEAEAGKRNADKLVKVFTKQGNAHFILLHIEVQGYKDEDFAERMFTYFYRIRDRWKADTTALAIFTDEYKDYSPAEYVYDFAGTRLLYQFNTFKVLEKTEQELDKPHNSFSIVMKVAKKAVQKDQLTDKKQLVWKVALTKELYQAGYSREKIQHIFDFLRFYVRFADTNNIPLFDTAVEPITKPIKPMGIREAIETALKEQGKLEGEAIGEAKGEAKGELKGELKADKKNTFGMLSEGLSPEAIARITKQPLETILEWKKEWEASLA
ncbi:MAG: hypothetical protein EAZ95_07005 [Bacteroidetes bacterium]|nr:MAG: hypothetical protein EAZ95_07005 [Bacteroidota bacterium]